MSTSDVESGTDLPSSSNSALPDQERHTERVVSRNGVREFLVVEHTANVRKIARSRPSGTTVESADALMIIVWRGIGVAHTVKAVPQS